MNIIPEKTTPALPCPPWCVAKHERDTGNSHHHRAERPIVDYDTGWVSLLMVDYGTSPLQDSNGLFDIHVNWYYDGRRTKSVVRPLAEAEQLAETAEALAREDVAALIRELAALAQDGAK